MAVRLERSDAVVTIVMDRPDARNAVDGAAFPPRCVRSDRRSAWEGLGLPLPAALAKEFVLGKATSDSGESQEGARRFADGAGRHGRF